MRSYTKPLLSRADQRQEALGRGWDKLTLAGRARSTHFPLLLCAESVEKGGKGLFQCHQLSPSACTLRDSAQYHPPGRGVGPGAGKAGGSFPHLHLSLHRTKLSTAPFSSPSSVATVHIMVAFCSPKFLQEDEVGRSRWDFTFLHPLQTRTKDIFVCLSPTLLCGCAWSLGVNWSSTSMLDAYPSKKQTQNKKSRCSTSEASSVGQKKHNPQGPS